MIISLTGPDGGIWWGWGGWGGSAWPSAAVPSRDIMNCEASCQQTAARVQMWEQKVILRCIS